MNIWDSLFLNPLLNGVMLFYSLTGNLGVSIIAFTVLVRVILIPLTLPSLRSTQKMKELAPYLERLKLRHKDDPLKLRQAQQELYRQHGVNIAAGCLPQIVQLVILIALFQAFYQVLTPNGDVVAKLNERLFSSLKLSEGSSINMSFFYLNLGQPDVIGKFGGLIPIPGIFIILSAIFQFVSSKMMIPMVSKEEKVAKKTPEATDDMMVSMQKSMLWIFPITTIFIGVVFPSGLVLYWFVFSLFQVVQQYFVSGKKGVASVLP